MSYLVPVATLNKAQLRKELLRRTREENHYLIERLPLLDQQQELIARLGPEAAGMVRVAERNW